MLSMFSGLDLTLDSSGAVVSHVNGGRSAAKDLLISKSTEKQAEAEFAALQALKKQQQKTQQQQNQQKDEPVTALSQALSLFDQEMNDRDSFVSRNTKRRQKSGQKTRGNTFRSRLQRQKKYQGL
ncbi:hypothetical protein KXD40_004909 [Peronospora effusa]|uniref:Uncharacterized protein n=1 Tax=Peronospora effusa TaxID=542832 RepID=A0A3M6VK78_9STRA|nr:hypothetical protein DD238_000789 [Peronospora effusa]RQM17382.1 hypothetical protein DD237_001360 [Peronospora effusa]UIZ22518.1 hypothetical protein KXD40_004909 [Peronospora effusa]CAI5708415.1 unnamed protein product [Peronospora effusa]